MVNYPVIWPQFFTATNYQWQHLLKDDEYKDIIVESLRFLVHDERIHVFAFVIMSNHVHLIWQPLKNFSISSIQTSFMRHTAKQILKLITQSNPDMLLYLKVNNYDRDYQVWKREPLNVELYTDAVFMQKLDYIHQNPVRANLVSREEDYKYSSASFYEYGVDNFDFLSHYAS